MGKQVVPKSLVNNKGVLNAEFALAVQRVIATLPRYTDIWDLGTNGPTAPTTWLKFRRTLSRPQKALLSRYLQELGVHVDTLADLSNLTKEDLAHYDLAVSNVGHDFLLFAFKQSP